MPEKQLCFQLFFPFKATAVQKSEGYLLAYDICALCFSISNLQRGSKKLELTTGKLLFFHCGVRKRAQFTAHQLLVRRQ